MLRGYLWDGAEGKKIKIITQKYMSYEPQIIDLKKKKYIIKGILLMMGYKRKVLELKNFKY